MEPCCSFQSEGQCWEAQKWRSIFPELRVGAALSPPCSVTVPGPLALPRLSVVVLMDAESSDLLFSPLKAGAGLQHCIPQGMLGCCRASAAAFAASLLCSGGY